MDDDDHEGRESPEPSGRSDAPEAAHYAGRPGEPEATALTPRHEHTVFARKGRYGWYRYRCDRCRRGGPAHDGGA